MRGVDIPLSTYTQHHELEFHRVIIPIGVATLPCCLFVSFQLFPTSTFSNPADLDTSNLPYRLLKHLHWCHIKQNQSLFNEHMAQRSDVCSCAINSGFFWLDLHLMLSCSLVRFVGRTSSKLAIILLSSTKESPATKHPAVPDTAPHRAVTTLTASGRANSIIARTRTSTRMKLSL